MVDLDGQQAHPQISDTLFLEFLEVGWSSKACNICIDKQGVFANTTSATNNRSCIGHVNSYSSMFSVTNSDEAVHSSFEPLSYTCMSLCG